MPGAERSSVDHDVGARAATAVAAEVRSLERHAVRNRLGNIRNAAFFLKRKVASSGLDDDARFGEFLDIIEAEVIACEGQLATTAEVERPATVVDLLHCVRCAATGRSDRRPATTPPPNTVTIEADWVDVSAALDLLMDLVSVPEPAFRWEVTGGARNVARVEIHFPASPPIEDDTNLRAARRLVRPWGGSVELSASEGRCVILFGA